MLLTFCGDGACSALLGIEARLLRAVPGPGVVGCRHDASVERAAVKEQRSLPQRIEGHHVPVARLGPRRLNLSPAIAVEDPGVAERLGRFPGSETAEEYGDA